MIKPLVCICVPFFNNKDTIKETLKSLLSQTYENIIIKIFDNASTDQSYEEIKSFIKLKNVFYFANKTNIGSEANFNKCIEHTEGCYSIICHADDTYIPTMIEELVNVFHQNKNISGVATAANTINIKGKVTGKLFIPFEYRHKKMIYLSQKTLLTQTCKYGNFIVCPSVMCKTDILKNNIKRWNGEKYNTSADLDVWLRLAKYGDFILLNKRLMNYRQSNYSFSARIYKIRVNKHDIFLVLDDWINSMKKDKDYSTILKYYNFLRYRDWIVICFNIIRNMKTNINFPKTSSRYSHLLKNIFTSKWHFKVIVYCSIIRVIIFLSPLKVRSFIKQHILKKTKDQNE